MLPPDSLPGAQSGKAENGQTVYSGHLYLAHKLCWSSVRNFDLKMRVRVLNLPSVTRAGTRAWSAEGSLDSVELDPLKTSSHPSAPSAPSMASVDYDLAYPQQQQQHSHSQHQRRENKSAPVTKLGRVSENGEDAPLCLLPPKQYERLVELVQDFLPRLRRFMSQLVRNRNFREPLASSASKSTVLTVRPSSNKYETDRAILLANQGSPKHTPQLQPSLQQQQLQNAQGNQPAWQGQVFVVVGSGNGQVLAGMDAVNRAYDVMDLSAPLPRHFYYDRSVLYLHSTFIPPWLFSTLLFVC